MKPNQNQKETSNNLQQQQSIENKIIKNSPLKQNGEGMINNNNINKNKNEQMINKQLNEVKMNNSQNKQDYFITEIPLETQKQIDKLRQQHRLRMQQQRESYQMQNKSIQQEQLQQEPHDMIINNNHSNNYNNIEMIKYLSPDIARKESIAIIEQGKIRRQKMINDNLKRLQNKLHQDAQKIDETINLLRIEIVETQRDIKEKAIIERKHVQEYHNSMHKQITDLLKMKHNIQSNQQAILINQIKNQKQNRNQRSQSESQFKSNDHHEFNYKDSNSSRILNPKKLFNKNNNHQDSIHYSKIDNLSNIYKKNDEFDNNNNHKTDMDRKREDYEDESLFLQYDENDVIMDNNSNNKDNVIYQTFNPKPLYRKMEEEYNSNVVLPDIENRENILKMRVEQYRKRMEPLKYFKDHEKKYEQVKEIKEKERIEKLQKHSHIMKQHSLEKFTQSQTYLKLLSDDHHKKENLTKQDLIHKILLDKSKKYQPTINNSHNLSKMKRSQSSWEISNSFYNNKSNIDKNNNGNVKNLKNQKIVESHSEQKQKMKQQEIDNHKNVLLNKNNKESQEKQQNNESKNLSVNRSYSESTLPLLNSDLKQQQQSQQQLNSDRSTQKLKRSKRRILTQKFHGDNSPLPEDFILDEFSSSPPTDHKRIIHRYNNNVEDEQDDNDDITSDLIKQRKNQSYSYNSILNNQKNEHDDQFDYSSPIKNKNNNQNNINSSDKNNQKFKNNNSQEKIIPQQQQQQSNHVNNQLNNKTNSNSDNIIPFNIEITHVNNNNTNNNKLIKLQDVNKTNGQNEKSNNNKINQSPQKNKSPNKLTVDSESQERNIKTPSQNIRKKQDKNIIESISKSDNKDLLKQNNNNNINNNHTNLESINNNIKQKEQKQNIENNKNAIIKQQKNDKTQSNQITTIDQSNKFKSQDNEIKLINNQTKQTNSNSIDNQDKQTKNNNINEQQSQSKIIQSHSKQQINNPISQQSSSNIKNNNNNISQQSPIKQKSPQKQQKEKDKEINQISEELDKQLMNGDIEQLYKKYKSIKGKSKRSISENIKYNSNDNNINNNNLPELNQLNNNNQSRIVNEYNKSKYKDYMRDMRQKYKLSQQIDDWRKIDQNDMLNNQQKIIKLSQKVQYLDNKLSQMRDVAKYNKGHINNYNNNNYSKENNKYDEDSLLLNSVQAKMAILTKLN